jgi:hypothetical protein
VLSQLRAPLPLLMSWTYPISLDSLSKVNSAH